MPISRRTLLKIVSVSLIALGLYRLWGGKPDRLISSTFPAFLDTLIPRDETPSATDLNIEKQFQDLFDKKIAYRTLVQFGCIWLDKNADKQFAQSFDQLLPEQREAVVKELEKLSDNETVEVFFTQVREDVFGFYYANPLSWQGLGFDRPPQPLGYADYDRAPSRLS